MQFDFTSSIVSRMMRQVGFIVISATEFITFSHFLTAYGYFLTASGHFLTTWSGRWAYPARPSQRLIA
jgi:hypothetical protein